MNPLFADDSLTGAGECSAGRQSPSSGYESRSGSRTTDSRSSSPLAEAEGWAAAKATVSEDPLPLDHRDLHAADSVRQLSEGLSRSPTLIAVCRALEAGAGGGAVGGAGGGTAARESFDSGVLLPYYTVTWSDYLGSGIAPGDITMKAKGYEHVMVSQVEMPRSFPKPKSIKSRKNSGRTTVILQPVCEGTPNNFRALILLTTAGGVFSFVLSGSVFFLSPEDLTLDAVGAARLLALVEAGKRRRCCCRAATALLAVLVFLATIVAVSMAVSRGERVFGAL